MEFDERTYLSQVRRLRDLAHEVLTHYRLGKYELDFINHGENATFKVKTAKKNYLLRIHCRSHRSKKAILEELKWFKSLTLKTDIDVQRPIKTKDGKLLIEVENESMGHTRICNILEWCPGFIKNQKNSDTFYKVGQLIGSLQSNQIKSKYRHYWHAEGLLGKDATFGNLKALDTMFPRYTDQLEKNRTIVLKALKTYEKKHPEKIGLIHADLHFGNMVWKNGEVVPIDFDDCGYGLLMYDLAVTLAQSGNYFKRIGKKKSRLAKEMLLAGYEESIVLSQHDREIIPYLVAARELTMLGWLYGRRDNPELLEHLKKNIGKRITRTERYIKEAKEKRYF